MQDFGHWKSPVPEIPDDAIGFVYKITHVESGRVYIGKKLLVSNVKQKPLKGKTRSRRVVKESDWKKYKSSSWELEELRKTHPNSPLEYEIIQFCCCKWELAWVEMEIQVKLKVLHHPEKYINGIVNVRLGRAPKAVMDKYQKLNETPG